MDLKSETSSERSEGKRTQVGLQRVGEKGVVFRNEGVGMGMKDIVDQEQL